MVWLRKKRCDFLILCPLSEELQAVTGAVRSLGPIDKGSGDLLSYYRGPVASRRQDEAVYDVVACSAPDMGQVQIVPALGEALTRWEPQAVVLAGIAAGVRSLKLGDVVIANTVLDVTVGTVEGGVRRPRITGTPAPVRLLDSARGIQTKRSGEGPGLAASFQLKVGPIASGNDVIKDHAIIESMQDHNEKVLAFEMEAAAFAVALTRYKKLEWAVVRGVSDYADSEKNAPGADAGRSAAKANMAACVFDLIASGPMPSRTLNLSRYVPWLLLIALGVALVVPRIGDWMTSAFPDDPGVHVVINDGSTCRLRNTDRRQRAIRSLSLYSGAALVNVKQRKGAGNFFPSGVLLGGTGDLPFGGSFSRQVPHEEACNARLVWPDLCTPLRECAQFYACWAVYYWVGDDSPHVASGYSYRWADQAGVGTGSLDECGYSSVEDQVSVDWLLLGNRRYLKERTWKDPRLEEAFEAYLSVQRQLGPILGHFPRLP